jgi:serine/threonine-protein kinase
MPVGVPVGGVPPSGIVPPPGLPPGHVPPSGIAQPRSQQMPAVSPDLFGQYASPVLPPAPAPAPNARNRRVLVVIGLAGIALLSFMIALAASNSSSRVASPQDAAIAVESNDDDDALPVAEPPVDASHTPTVPIDAAAARSAMGLLVVRTIPDGGTIKVGDQVREATVQPGDPTGARTAQLLLEAGRYKVEAQLAGYQPETRDVIVDGGENKMIEVTFTKKISVRPDRGHSPSTGRLTVRTTPWSDVYVGGKKLGQAPFADLELPIGTYTLTFKNPSRPTVTKSVTIKAGKPTKLNFSLP